MVTVGDPPFKPPEVSYNYITYELYDFPKEDAAWCLLRSLAEFAMHREPLADIDLGPHAAYYV
jgi:hypothetical protein